MSDSALSTTEPVDAELRLRIRRGIEEALPRVLNQELPENLDNVCFFDDLGLTSVGTIELVLEIEETLDIQVNVERLGLDDLRSIDKLADYVVGHIVEED
ncbi:acyl carrier protein [Kitasatospora sp. NPDC051853]|uniref:acyl carrier protein n=1 Tax=Kitasatospora sp. NPDC051853 TaxID=3364058 RepID=UPI00379C7B75